jgi:hypothetical protein
MELTWSQVPGRRQWDQWELDQDPDYVVSWLSLAHYAVTYQGEQLNERTDCTFDAARGYAERHYQARHAPEPAPELFRRQVTPDMAVVADGGGVVLEVTNDLGCVLRRVAVTNIAEFHDALIEARTANGLHEHEAEQRRREGIDEAEAARGRLSRSGAVERLVTHYVPRAHAAHVVSRAASVGPQRVQGRDPEGGTRPVELVVTFLGGPRFSVTQAEELRRTPGAERQS